MLFRSDEMASRVAQVPGVTKVVGITRPTGTRPTSARPPGTRDAAAPARHR